jgi:hypothetical protein
LILLPLSLILSRKGRGEKEEQGEKGKRRAKGEGERWNTLPPLFLSSPFILVSENTP